MPRLLALTLVIEVHDDEDGDDCDCDGAHDDHCGGGGDDDDSDDGSTRGAGHDHARRHLRQHHHMVVTTAMFTMVHSTNTHVLLAPPALFVQAPAGQSAYSWNRRDPPRPLLPRRPILSRGCKLHAFFKSYFRTTPHGSIGARLQPPDPTSQIRGTGRFGALPIHPRDFWAHGKSGDFSGHLLCAATATPTLADDLSFHLTKP